MVVPGLPRGEQTVSLGPAAPFANVDMPVCIRNPVKESVLIKS